MSLDEVRAEESHFLFANVDQDLVGHMLGTSSGAGLLLLLLLPSWTTCYRCCMFASSWG